MDDWLAMIPGRRICHPAELKSVCKSMVFTQELRTNAFIYRHMCSWLAMHAAT